MPALTITIYPQARISSQNKVFPLWTIPLLPQTSKHPQFVCMVGRYKGYARLPWMGCWMERGVGDTAKGGFFGCFVGEGEYWGRGNVLSLRASPPQARRGKFNLSKWLCTTKCTYSGCGEVSRLKIITLQDQDPTSLIKK